MNKTKLTVACIQTNAGPEILPNLEQAAQLVRSARAQGAELIALPECASLMTKGRENLFARAKPEAEHPALPFFSALAKETGAWLMSGSHAIVTKSGRLANRCYFYNPVGEQIAHYDKIHLYDADPCETESYRESSRYRPGDKAVIVDTPWGKIGLTICYDIRFPHLYRALAKAGASIIMVPAAFVLPTSSHWSILLRARAIETGCFIIAPGQCGEHEGGRCTFGHSLIINPWGEILAEAGDTPGVIFSTIDLSEVETTRKRLPSLQHDRPFTLPLSETAE